MNMIAFRCNFLLSMRNSIYFIYSTSIYSSIYSSIYPSIYPSIYSFYTAR